MKISQLSKCLTFWAAISLQFFGMFLSVVHLYSSRPFQRAIVELCRRQGSKVIEETDDGRRTDDKVTYKAVFFQKRAKKQNFYPFSDQQKFSKKIPFNSITTLIVTSAAHDPTLNYKFLMVIVVSVSALTSSHQANLPM
jgi:hypothetical protein